jgi:hypothetical protein
LNLLRSDVALKSLTKEELKVVAEYPFHFSENVDHSDEAAIISSLKNFKQNNGATIVDVAQYLGAHDQNHPERLANIS